MFHFEGVRDLLAGRFGHDSLLLGNPVVELIDIWYCVNGVVILVACFWPETFVVYRS